MFIQGGWPRESEDGEVLYTAIWDVQWMLLIYIIAKDGIQKEDRPVAKNEKRRGEKDSSVIPLQAPLRVCHRVLSFDLVQFRFVCSSSFSCLLEYTLARHLYSLMLLFISPYSSLRYLSL
jgi:hypothetical protein